ncbi:MAG: allose kinase [Treponema sp.]|nr:allose kinase [Treponema sp.]
MKILGLDIGGTNVRSGFYGDDDTLSRFAVHKSSEILADNAAGRLVEYIKKRAGEELPGAVSVGAPSTVDRDNRIIYSTPNIAGLNNVPIAEFVESSLHIPCFVSRDVCLLLLYDMYDNNISPEGFTLGFYAGTGLGNAIAYNGKLVTGRHGVAAELGHIPVLGKDDLCGCGNRGCIELYASGKRLAQINGEKYPGLAIGEMLARHSDDPDIKEFVDNLGAAVAVEINILDPENVILGGGVILSDGFPKKALEQAIRKYARKPYPEKGLSFIYSKESHENGVIGAAIFARTKLSQGRFSALV